MVYRVFKTLYFSNRFCHRRPASCDWKSHFNIFVLLALSSLTHNRVGRKSAESISTCENTCCGHVSNSPPAFFIRYCEIIPFFQTIYKDFEVYMTWMYITVLFTSFVLLAQCENWNEHGNVLFVYMILIQRFSIIFTFYMSVMV